MTNQKIIELQKKLEKTYPTHNFSWRTVGNEIRGFCPEHNDKGKPNLYVADKGNGAFCKCFACRFKGTINTIGTHQFISPITEIITRMANIFADTLVENESLNAKIANKYLEFRNPHLKQLIRGNLLVGVVGEEFGLGKIEAEIQNAKKQMVSENEKKTKEEEEKEKKFNKLLKDIEKLTLSAQPNVPVAFFYTNQYGFVEQIKFRYIYNKPNNIRESDIESIDWTKEREDKQFSIMQTDKQTENAFGLHLYNIAQHKFFTFITEGEFNTLSFLGKMYEINDDDAFEIYRAISIGSAQNLEQNIGLFKYLRKNNYNIVFALDNDQAGRNALMNFIETHKEFANCLTVTNADINKDFDDYINAEESSGEDLYKAFKVKPIKDMLSVFKTKENDAQEQQIQTIMNNAVKNGFLWIRDALALNSNEDNIPLDLSLYSEKVERDWLIKDILHKDIITVFAGLGGSGKTTIALQWLMHLLFEIPLNPDIPAGFVNKVTIISAEENRQEIASKILRLLEYFAEKTTIPIDTLKQQLKNRIQVITHSKILTEQEFGKVVKTQQFETVKSLIDSFEPDIVLIDSLTSTNIARIQDTNIAQGVMMYIEELIENRTCLLLHHLAKDSVNAEDITKIQADKILGSASLTNKVRQVLLLYKKGLKIAKSNLLPMDSIDKYYYELSQTVKADGSRIDYGVNIKKVDIGNNSSDVNKQDVKGDKEHAESEF